MMTPHEFFRNAAKTRRNELGRIEITGCYSSLEGQLIRGIAVPDSAVPQKKEGNPYTPIAGRIAYLKS